MNNPELFSESNAATYCPEDNKLRLYVGRVPRDEYDALRAEGWHTTPKQSEAGQGEFAATWTPAREDTAISYAGIIGDEDAGPAERAADRAERFTGYLGRRLGEAGERADRYEGKDPAHGYQSAEKAERAAARHDRIADRAINAWDKAEYWEQRTRGVISHALYVSTPGVRMGRIKVLESKQRKAEKTLAEYTATYRAWKPDNGSHSARWRRHYENRLAYERQMLEAQGGRAGVLDIEPGGFINGKQIQKVNKSPATGRVVSVYVLGTHTGYSRASGYKEYETIPCLKRIEVERMSPDAYRAPTEEELAAFNKAQAEEKAKRKATSPKTVPLVNPTDADAERLQSELNKRSKADNDARQIKAYGKVYTEYKPSTVFHMTQAQYSAYSKGTYGRGETRGLCKSCEMEPRASNMWRPREEEEAKRRGPAVCKIRIGDGDGSDYGARRVVVLTDKPQKPLPGAVWAGLEAKAKEEATA